jgi:hypothetical protein
MASVTLLGCTVDGGGDVGGSAACESPEPLTSPATGMPTGFVRCSDGFIHRDEVVAIPEVQTPPNSSCGWDSDHCMTDADCNGGSPDGLARCVQLFGCSSFCGCVGSCEVDNDCGPGRACVGAEFTGDVPRCVPAGCSDSSECGEGLCGISVMKAEDDSHPTIELACMTDSSACRMDNCTLSDIPNASRFVEPTCLAVDGQWTCVAVGGVCG